MKGNDYKVMRRDGDSFVLIYSLKSKASAYRRATELSDGGNVAIVEKYNGVRRDYEVMLFRNGEHTMTMKKYHPMLGNV